MQLSLMPTLGGLSQTGLLVDFMHELDEDREIKAYFSLQARAQLILITGPTGIGKSFLSAHLTYRMMKLNMSDRAWNISAHSNAVSGHLNTSEPFSGWRALVMSVLATYGKIKFPELEKQNSNNKTKGASKTEKSENYKLLAMKGLDAIIQRLSPDVQEYRPLLGVISSIFAMPDNEVTKELTGITRFHRTKKIIEHIMQAFVNDTGNILLLHM